MLACFHKCKPRISRSGLVKAAVLGLAIISIPLFNNFTPRPDKPSESVLASRQNTQASGVSGAGEVLGAAASDCPIPGGAISTPSYQANPANGHCGASYSYACNCGTGGRRAKAIDVQSYGQSVRLPTINGQSVNWTLIVGPYNDTQGGLGYTFRANLGADTWYLDMVHLNKANMSVGGSYSSNTPVATTTIGHVHATIGKNLSKSPSAGSATDCDPNWLPSDFMCSGGTSQAPPQTQISSVEGINGGQVSTRGDGTRVVRGSVKVGAYVTVPAGHSVENVAFHAGEDEMYTDNSAPYEVSGDTHTTPDGPLTISATAKDQQTQQTGTASVPLLVDNTKPLISIAEPAGTELKGTVLFRPNVSDAASGVKVVVFLWDGAEHFSTADAPYQLLADTTETPNGWHQLTMRVYDHAGNYAEDSKWVEIKNIDTLHPNLVEIKSPANGTTLSGWTWFKVAAADSTYGIGKVEFFINGTKVYTDYYSNDDPEGYFAYEWKVGDPPYDSSGDYHLIARAYDKANPAHYRDDQIDVTVSVIPAVNYCTDTGYHACTPGDPAGGCVNGLQHFETYKCSFEGQSYCDTSNSEPCGGQQACTVNWLQVPPNPPSNTDVLLEVQENTGNFENAVFSIDYGSWRNDPYSTNQQNNSAKIKMNSGSPGSSHNVRIGLNNGNTVCTPEANFTTSAEPVCAGGCPPTEPMYCENNQTWQGTGGTCQFDANNHSFCGYNYNPVPGDPLHCGDSAPVPNAVLPSCIDNANTGLGMTFSWADSDPAVSYVDISTDNFATFYHKQIIMSGPYANAYVEGSYVYTDGSGFSGAGGVSGLLKYNPGTTYYIRTWNGFQNSSTAVFTTPAVCITPSPAPSPTPEVTPTPAPTPIPICPGGCTPTLTMYCENNQTWQGTGGTCQFDANNHSFCGYNYNPVPGDPLHCGDNQGPEVEILEPGHNTHISSHGSGVFKARTRDTGVGLGWAEMLVISHDDWELIPLQAQSTNSGNGWKTYQADWQTNGSPFPAGDYTLRVISYDLSNNMTQKDVAVTIDAPPDIAGPDLRLVEPTSHATTYNWMWFKVKAKDSAGLSSVRLYARREFGNKEERELTIDRVEPSGDYTQYASNWHSGSTDEYPAFPPGEYTLRAVAFDNQQNQSSVAVGVTVKERVCEPGSWDKHCSGRCAGCGSGAGEEVVKECKPDGSGWYEEYGQCVNTCAGPCQGPPPPPPSSCGKVCIYSDENGCHLGNCSDGSQNCSTNSNCGWVDGCSEGGDVECPSGPGDDTFSTGPSVPSADKDIPPQVAITSPAGGGQIWGGQAFVIRAAVEDTGRGVSRVEFYYDNQLIENCTRTMAPYSCVYTPVSKGLVSNKPIGVRAYDRANRSRMATVNVNLVWSPLQLLSSASPQPSSSPSRRVRQTPSPSSIPVRTVKPTPAAVTGPAALQAPAAVISTPPQVTITSPTLGSQIWSGQAFTISASVAESSRGVSRVEFYYDNQLIGNCTATAAPYSCTYTAPRANSLLSTRTIGVKAYDRANNARVTNVNVTLLVNPLQFFFSR